VVRGRDGAADNGRADEPAPAGQKNSHATPWALSTIDDHFVQSDLALPGNRPPQTPRMTIRRRPKTGIAGRLRGVLPNVTRRRRLT